MKNFGPEDDDIEVDDESYGQYYPETDNDCPIDILEDEDGSNPLLDIFDF